MKILIFGDIFGRIGRKAIKINISKLKEKYNPTFIIANIENITGGRWPILRHILEMKELWIDLFTGGDHVFDNEKDILEYLDDNNSKLLRPANLYEHYKYKIPGKWYKIIEKNWKRLLVIHLLGQVFMKFDVYNPFLKSEEIIKELKLSGEKIDWIIIDFHRETTSEIYALANHLNWKISLVYGTHTHIQTNDEIILSWGTWLISDVGMSWAIDSIIWSDYRSLEKRFLTGINRGKIEPKNTGKYISYSIVADIENMRCLSIEKIKIIEDNI